MEIQNRLLLTLGAFWWLAQQFEILVCRVSEYASFLVKTNKGAMAGVHVHHILQLLCRELYLDFGCGLLAADDVLLWLPRFCEMG